MLINQLVKTPIGEGRCQGNFDGDVLVRLPINEVTSAHKQDSNCITPLAKVSGLWVFSKGDLL
jgi:hypothetical protein